MMTCYLCGREMSFTPNKEFRTCFNDSCRTVEPSGYRPIVSETHSPTHQTYILPVKIYTGSQIKKWNLIKGYEFFNTTRLVYSINGKSIKDIPYMPIRHSSFNEDIRLILKTFCKEVRKLNIK
jgi:hypothetical protein